MCVSMVCIDVLLLSPVGSNDVHVAVTSPSEHSVALYIFLPIGLYITYIQYSTVCIYTVCICMRNNVYSISIISPLFLMLLSGNMPDCTRCRAAAASLEAEEHQHHPL